MLKTKNLTHIFFFFILGQQPAQIVFDHSLEDKAETPGEVPDPEKGGLGGARPLGISISNENPASAHLHPPDHPPPPPPIIKKIISVPPPPPPKPEHKIDH